MCSKHWAVFNIAIWFALLNNVQSRNSMEGMEGGKGGVKIHCYLFFIYASTRQFCTFWIFEVDGGSTNDRKCIFFSLDSFLMDPLPNQCLVWDISNSKNDLHNCLIRAHCGEGGSQFFKNVLQSSHIKLINFLNFFVNLIFVVCCFYFRNNSC